MEKPQLILQGEKVIADLRAAITASRRSRRDCPECPGNPPASIDQDCQVLAGAAVPTPRVVA